MCLCVCIFCKYMRTSDAAMVNRCVPAWAANNASNFKFEITRFCDPSFIFIPITIIIIINIIYISIVIIIIIISIVIILSILAFLA
jgi:hypothetical protein